LAQFSYFCLEITIILGSEGAGCAEGGANGATAPGIQGRGHARLKLQKVVL